MDRDPHWKRNHDNPRRMGRDEPRLTAFFASHVVPARPAVRRSLQAHLGACGLRHRLFRRVARRSGVADRGGSQRSAYPALGFRTLAALGSKSCHAASCACLIAYGIAAPNPFSIAGRGSASFDPGRPGIAGITRHPLLLAITLWALAHMVPNGDLPRHVVRPFRRLRHRGHGGARRTKAETMGIETLGGAGSENVGDPLCRDFEGKSACATSIPTRCAPWRRWPFT